MPDINTIVNINVSNPATALQEGDFSTACIFTTETPDDPSFDFFVNTQELQEQVM